MGLLSSAQPHIKKSFVPVQMQADAENFKQHFCKIDQDSLCSNWHQCVRQTARPDRVVTDHQQPIKDVNIHQDIWIWTLKLPHLN